ncbi:UNVERIFIED_CONTAM: hypothetical protein RMT77_019977 [Armadillidium vulgare]
MKLTYFLVVFLVCLTIFATVNGMPAKEIQKKDKKEKCYRFALTKFTTKIMRTGCRGRAGKPKKYSKLYKQ